jgi:hypothetical protein
MVTISEELVEGKIVVKGRVGAIRAGVAALAIDPRDERDENTGPLPDDEGPLLSTVAKVIGRAAGLCCANIFYYYRTHFFF